MGMGRVMVGVDTGKLQHQAAAYAPDSNQLLGQIRFAVSRPGFEQFVSFLTRLADGNRSRDGAGAADRDEDGDGTRESTGGLVVGVEASGHYHLTLAEYLLERGYSVVLVNPYRATQFRRSQGKRAKTDRLDAQALARFLATHAPQGLQLLSAEPSLADVALAQLRELTRLRADLVQDRTAAINRLHGVVDLAFPELPSFFSHFANATVLALLEAYPTASAVVAADPDIFAALLRHVSKGVVGAEKAGAISAAARSSVALRRTEGALATKIRILARQVAALSREIAALEEAIEQEFAALGYRPEQFPAGRAVALATLLAETGDVHRFPSVKQFLAHFGWCPTDEQSGAYKNPHPPLSKAGNRYVRHLIFMLAVGVVRHPGPYRDYFERRVAAGKKKMDTLIAIGRKLLSTVYAILKTGCPYDPSYRTGGARHVEHVGQVV